MDFNIFILFGIIKYIPIKSDPIIIYVIVLSFVVAGIGKKTDRILSPISLALSITATPA